MNNNFVGSCSGDADYYFSYDWNMIAAESYVFGETEWGSVIFSGVGYCYCWSQNFISSLD